MPNTGPTVCGVMTASPAGLVAVHQGTNYTGTGPVSAGYAKWFLLNPRGNAARWVASPGTGSPDRVPAYSHEGVSPISQLPGFAMPVSVSCVVASPVSIISLISAWAIPVASM